jgi:hypothetical protein
MVSVGAINLNASEVSHVVVIPDIHGDSHALLRSLWLAVIRVDSDQPILSFREMVEAFEIFRSTNKYNGPKLAVRQDVVLVQLGDVVDRGPYGVESLCVLSGIEKIIGWKFLQLYGNHELLNFVGAAEEYVHPKEASMLSSVGEDRSEIFSPGGFLHEEITKRSLGMARLASEGNASTLFVHGGVDLEWMESYLMIADGDVERINAEISRIAKSKNITEVDILNHRDSPLWTRTLASGSDLIACELVEEILERFNVHRIVVGHTPQSDFLAKTRCDGKIVLTDVMMSRWMLTRDVDETSNTGGRPVAVILKINKEEGNLESMIAHYTDLTGSRIEWDDLLNGGSSSSDEDDDDFDEDEFVDVEEEVKDPELKTLVALHREGGKAVFESVYVSLNGITHILLNGGNLDHDLLRTIATALKTYSPFTGSMIAPSDLRTREEMYVPFYFIQTGCERLFPAESLAEPPRNFKRLLRRAVQVTVSRLHGQGLLLGLTDEKQILSSFGLCANTDSYIFLIDWSTIRRPIDGSEVDSERLIIDTLTQRMLI